MNIYHFHPDTGVYLSSGQADESPLEPGVWLLPAHSTTQQPPQPGAGEQAVWVDSAWQVQPIPEPTPEPTPDPVPPLVPIIEPGVVLTTEEKLATFGLTVVELKELFGLT